MKKAFTIGEIFTALVIVGILIAVLAPSVRNLTSRERRESVLFKKAYYALEKAVEAAINDSRFYSTGDFGNTNIAEVDGKEYEGESKFYNVIKDHFNVVDDDDDNNTFIIKDNVGYAISCGDFSTDPCVSDIFLDGIRDNAFQIEIFANGRMRLHEPNGGWDLCNDVNSTNSQCKAKRYLEHQGLLGSD